MDFHLLERLYRRGIVFRKNTNFKKELSIPLVHGKTYNFVGSLLT